MPAARVSDDPIEMTYAEAADMTRRYYELKRVESDLKKQLEAMNNALRDFIEKRQEPIDVEGLPVLRLKKRSNGWTFDVENMATGIPAEYQRMLEKGALAVNKKVADALAEAGVITRAYMDYGFEGETTALVFDRER